MKNRSRGWVLAMLATCIGTVSADWLVVETGSTRFTAYELLPEGTTITLGNGEEMTLLADSGTKVAFTGPGRFVLDEAAIGAGGGPAAAGDATLTRRLSKLLTAQGQVEKAGVVRSVKDASSVEKFAGRGYLDINAPPKRCLDEESFVLVRDDTQKLETAYIVLKSGERILQKGTWYAGFNDLQLTFAPGDYDRDAGMTLEIYVGKKKIRDLVLVLLPGSLTVYDKLDFMFESGCRADIAQLISSLPPDASFR